MARKVLIVGGHGLGDSIFSLQCAHYVKQAGDELTIHISTRDEVFNPLVDLFKDYFRLLQLPEGLDETWLSRPTPSLYENAYYCLPDWLFSNPQAFDFKRYMVSPHVIKTTRLLTQSRIQQGEKIVYLGLMTSTKGYLYSDCETLAVKLAQAMPEYTFVFPTITKWANSEVQKLNFPEIPSNLIIYRDLNFKSALDAIRRADYFIGTDNGPSHVAYQYGVPRLILDPQYNKLPWTARWKEDVTESIPLSTSWPDIVNTVKVNLQYPPSLLVPRATVMANAKGDWKQLLFNKF